MKIASEKRGGFHVSLHRVLSAFGSILAKFMPQNDEGKHVLSIENIRVRNEARLDEFKYLIESLKKNVMNCHFNKYSIRKRVAFIVSEILNELEAFAASK